jgi:hypothetical protein
MFILSNFIYILIKIYQWVFRPLLGNRCRFHPSCSEYLKDAVMVHGPFIGSYLGIKRVCRCAPWSLGGYDPVPQKKIKL